MSDTTLTAPTAAQRLVELGERLRNADLSLTSTAWLIGTTLLEARPLLCKRGEWVRWLDEYLAGWSRATLNRYMRLAESFTEAELDGVPLMEAYRKLGIKNGATKESDGKRSGRAGETTPVASAGTGTAQVVNEAAAGSGGSRESTDQPRRPLAPKSSQIDVEVSSDEEDELPPAEALARDLADLPDVLYGARDHLAEIRASHARTRRACWKRVDNRGEIRELLNGLRDDLTWLEDDMPDEPAQAA